jgi:hypothetical protein
VLHGRPSPHLEADRPHDGQGRGRVKARNGRAVDPRPPRPRPAPVAPRSVAGPLSRPCERRPRRTGTALSACRTGRVELAVTGAALRVRRVLEGTSWGPGQARRRAPVPMERLGHGGLSLRAAISSAVGQRPRGALPGEAGSHKRPPRLPCHGTDAMLALAVHWREGLGPRREVLAGRGPPQGAVPPRAAQDADRIRGAQRPGQPTNGREPLPPWAVMASTLRPPPALPSLWRVDQPHLAPPALQSRPAGAPRDSRRRPGDRRETPLGQPVGQGGSGDGVRPTAAHRLRIVTRGNRHIMGFGPHVNARGVEIDGRKVRGESRLRASQLWLPLRHDDLH